MEQVAQRVAIFGIVIVVAEGSSLYLGASGFPLIVALIGVILGAAYLWLSVGLKDRATAAGKVQAVRMATIVYGIATVADSVLAGRTSAALIRGAIAVALVVQLGSIAARVSGESDA